VPTFAYSPQIRAHIATDRDTFDVSHDITAGTVNRSKGVSSFSLTLTNRGRKYDGKFSPMDRVTIYLKRIGPFLLVMSGYLDAVPAYSTYSGSIRLRGSCTLKRLQHWQWDPTSEAGAALLTDLSQVDGNDPSITDGGIAKRVVTILDEVMGWPKQKVHIGAVPDDWFESLGEIGARVIAEAEMAEMVSLVGNGSVADNHIQGTSEIAGIGKGTGVIPHQIVTVGTFGGANGEPGRMSLTREPIRLADSARAEWGGQYYVQAPWPYFDAQGRPASGVDVGKAATWWRNRSILLTNPRTGKSVIARAAHYGPTAGSAHIRVSRPVWAALGMEAGQAVHMAFPPTEYNEKWGPVDKANPAAAFQGIGSVPVPGLGAIANAAVSAASADMPRHPVAPIVNTFAALEDFLRWCVAKGITVHEHPHYGGVNPEWHASIAEGGFHSWPAPNGGGAADIYVKGGGENMMRLLDEAALEASKRNLGVIWRAPNHWDHMHVALQNSREIGRLVYASDAELRALPPLRTLDGSPGAVGSGGSSGSTPDGTSAADPARIGEALFQTFERMASWRTSAAGRLGGKRALMNDTPLYSTIDELFKVGLRDWCSAPNGDIIAWFPDYFGRFGTSAKMIVEPIEVAGDGFNIEWSDERLKTHMFVTGAQSNAGRLLENPGLGSASEIVSMETTAGLASVEFPEMMKAVFGLTGPLYQDGAKAFLERFGARPDWEPMDIIKGPRAEFFFSVYRFMKNWSQQYSARVNLTFMPELYPGMIVAFPHWGMQAYVDGVTHSINMETGFTTSVQLSAWSKIAGHSAVIPGLPVGGKL